MSKLDDALAAIEAPEALKVKSIVDLKMRVMLLAAVIKEAQQDGDDRWERLVPQQRLINEVLVAKIKQAREREGIPEPEPVAVNMKPAILTGEATSVR